MRDASKGASHGCCILLHPNLHNGDLYVYENQQVAGRGDSWLGRYDDRIRLLPLYNN